MLRIPSAGDVTPPLVVPVREVASEVKPAAEPALTEESDDQLHGQRRRKRRGKKGQELIEWDEEPSVKRLSRAADRQRMAWMFVTGLALFALLIVAVFKIMASSRDPQSAPVVGIVPPPPPTAVPAATPTPDTPELELPPIMQRNELSLLAEAEPLARQFLEATSVEEMLPLVRSPDAAAPRMRAFYPNGKIAPPGLSVFNSSGTLNYRDSIVSVDFLTRAHESRQLAFVEIDGKLKIDWESFAGWSEVPWEEFIDRRMAEPKVFRVILGQDEYYNFDFHDDSIWQSFRLESPNGEHVLYGYVERDSLLHQQLRPDHGSDTAALMISLRFPPNAKVNNQVIIESYLTDGWIED